MTGIGQVLTGNFIGLIVAIFGLWAGARAIRDVSFVDAFWPFGMVLLAWGSAVQAGFDGQRTQLILALVTLWGLRLQGPTPRKPAMKVDHGLENLIQLPIVAALSPENRRVGQGGVRKFRPRRGLY